MIIIMITGTKWRLELNCSVLQHEEWNLRYFQNEIIFKWFMGPFWNIVLKWNWVCVSAPIWAALPQGLLDSCTPASSSVPNHQDLPSLKMDHWWGTKPSLNAGQRHIMVSTSANWVLLMYVFLSVLEGAASENHHSHLPEIAVAGRLCCLVCTKQDAALLVTGGGRRQHGIFQHFSHLWPPVLASSQRWDLACLWCGKLCWSMTGDLLTVLELYTQEMHS